MVWEGASTYQAAIGTVTTARVEKLKNGIGFISYKLTLIGSSGAGEMFQNRHSGLYNHEIQTYHVSALSLV